MKVVRIIIKNFRCIKEAKIYPSKDNVLLGPNNSGKTTILEGLNLALSPELAYRGKVIDENDFFQRRYCEASDSAVADVASQQELSSGENDENSCPPASSQNNEYPKIYIEVVLSELSEQDEDLFRNYLVPWSCDDKEVLESTSEGEDPFSNAEPAIRVFFEAWYDPNEDDFDFHTKFLRTVSDDHEDCPTFIREHKRHIGFLIYRDFRALTRPITLEPAQLFNRLMQSFGVLPRQLEQVLIGVEKSLEPVNSEPDFSALLSAYQSEIERYLPLSEDRYDLLSFDLTDRTRNQMKAAAQLYFNDKVLLPIQKSGAGTRSLSILAMLTIIMRKRGSGILALEEPETFLFPHAQRRVIDECLSLANQTFITTHSPFILERIPVEGVGRVTRTEEDIVDWRPLSSENVKQINLYTKRLRQVHCEALMGRGVVIVEGDSDRWWLIGASRILNGKIWNSRNQEAFELQGISIVSAESAGDIVKLGKFFNEVGLKAIGVFDCPNDLDDFLKITEDINFPIICLSQKGLEEVIVNQLPESILRQFLSEAKHCKNQPVSEGDLAAMNFKAVKNESLIRLIKNKGSGSMHEWLISLLDHTSFPSTLCNLIDIISAHIKGEQPLFACSLRN